MGKKTSAESESESASGGTVHYSVAYQVNASTVGTVSFDPAGMSHAEIIRKAIYEAETDYWLCAQCGSHLTLGDLGEAGEVTADGEVIWDDSQPLPGDEPRDLGMLWDTADIGALFGVPASTIRTWRSRYSITDTPCPKPNGWAGKKKPVPLWLPEREQEWREWERNRRRRWTGIAGRQPVQGQKGAEAAS